jgi:hypothetical protein
VIKKLLAGLGALVITPLLYLGATSTTASATCTNAPYLASAQNIVGGSLDGTWDQHYNPDCDGTTVGDVTVIWHSYLSGGDRYVKFDAQITTQAIDGNDCVEVALDWNGGFSGSGHEDNQIMRNCKENSTETMAAQTIDIDQACLPSGLWCSLNSWPTNRLQVSRYDPDNQEVYDRVCPAGGVAPGTNSQVLCWGDQDPSQGWHPNGGFTTKAAKIYRIPNGGTPEQNTPLWPGDYTVMKLTDPNN